MPIPALPVQRAVLFLALGGLSGFAIRAADLSPAPAPAPTLRDPASAPPVAPPERVSEGTGPAGSPLAGLHANAGGIYSIGEPTDEEQLYVEFINRARADPIAEGLRFVNETDPDILGAYAGNQVDLGLLLQQFQAIAPAAPVSIHPALTQAARRHARDMLVNGFQGHDGTDGSNVGTRATDAGYEWRRVAENVYARAKSVWYGHAGFNVDWGPGPGGIQTPPGHRNNIHNANNREIGVGVTNGVNGTIGPQVVAQALADRNGLTPFVTGVVFYDFNGNHFYDLGEGLGGVTVRVSNTGVRAVTARSGGYSVPVSGDGDYAVTFEVPGLDPVSKPASVFDSESVKVDHSPTYLPPFIQGPTRLPATIPTGFSFSAVGGATSYLWRSARRTPWTEVGTAENGLGTLVAETSPGYDVLDATRSKSGKYSFRLGHIPSPVAQYLTLPRDLRLGAASVLTFWSRHSYAGSAQTARVQLSTDEGRTWIDLWTQVGSGDAGETAFTQRSLPLAAYAGRTARFRFAYTIGNGGYFDASGPGVGWNVDDFTITRAEELDGVSVQATPDGTPAFAYTPPATGAYVLEVRARVGDRELPWGPSYEVTVVDPVTLPPRVSLGLPAIVEGGIDLPFQVLQGAPASFELHGASSLDGPWLPEAGAVFPAGARVVRVPSAAANAPARFFRIQAR